LSARFQKAACFKRRSVTVILSVGEYFERCAALRGQCGRHPPGALDLELARSQFIEASLYH
jgi:hypothetical protein